MSFSEFCHPADLLGLQGLSLAKMATVKNFEATFGLTEDS